MSLAWHCIEKQDQVWLKKLAYNVLVYLWNNLSICFSIIFQFKEHCDCFSKEWRTFWPIWFIESLGNQEICMKMSVKSTVKFWCPLTWTKNIFSKFYGKIGVILVYFSISFEKKYILHWDFDSKTLIIFQSFHLW